MSEFKFSCPHCQQNISAPPEYAGVQISCPTCKTAIVVPEAPGAPAPAQAPAAPKGKLSKAASTVHHAATSTAMAATTVRKAKKPPYKLYIGLGVAVVVAVAAAIFVPKAIDKYHERQEAEKAAAAAAAAAAEAAKIPPDLQADKILKKVDETYKGFTSFSAQGESVGTMDMSQINAAMKDPQITKAKVSILLAKPDLYRLEWEREAGKKTIKGAVWSAGKGDFLRTAAAPVRLKNRAAALASAAQSGTLGVGFAEMFFGTTNSLASDMKNFSKSNNETLNGHKCYVLAGEVSHQNIVLWIHKDDFLIQQVEVMLGGKIDPSALAKLSAMQKAQAQMMSKMRGNITETYSDIEINKALNADAFEKEIKLNPHPKAKKPKEPKAGRPGSPKPE